jgi:phosphoribosyl 1,2-cyclic phosphodiesterase
VVQRSSEPLPVYASRETITAVRRRLKRLDHCDFVQVRPGRQGRLGQLTVTALTVPHAPERRHPTFAWKLDAAGTSLVYASDVARLTAELERFAAGASLLVIDGAIWRRRLFSHLTIDAELPRLCRWRVERILLTQLGRTLPPHDELLREARKLCRRAAPAYDGMEVPVGE